MKGTITGKMFDCVFREFTTKDGKPGAYWEACFINPDADYAADKLMPVKVSQQFITDNKVDTLPIDKWIFLNKEMTFEGHFQYMFKVPRFVIDKIRA